MNEWQAVIPAQIRPESVEFRYRSGDDNATSDGTESSVCNKENRERR